MNQDSLKNILAKFHAMYPHRYIRISNEVFMYSSGNYEITYELSVEDEKTKTFHSLEELYDELKNLVDENKKLNTIEEFKRLIREN